MLMYNKTLEVVTTYTYLHTAYVSMQFYNSVEK